MLSGNLLGIKWLFWILNYIVMLYNFDYTEFWKLIASRFAASTELHQLYYHIITNRLHVIVNSNPFNHKLIADWKQTKSHMIDNTWFLPSSCHFNCNKIASWLHKVTLIVVVLLSPKCFPCILCIQLKM